ncbi:LysR substrate-binding domain-containing protein [uncultured Sulfitobacter sp.]|uniref:LysR substrate-binding domain-containing protein n=1 Tax=uncultured Sulfitobacter sp. TaxID=191468 RepID=UPI00343C156E
MLRAPTARLSHRFANNGVNTRNSVSVDSLHAMVGLAVAGRGVCITPRSYLIRLIESGRVVEIPTEPPLPAMQYCVVHYPSPHAALFTQIAHDIHSVADFGTPYFV